jgi:hypothetical protein
MLAVLAVTGRAEAGRTPYGWLYGTEVLPEKSVELQQWVYERNGFDDPDTHDTALWWGALIGVTDKLELALPIEFLWHENPDGIAPLVRFAVKRDVLNRGSVVLQGDFVMSYQKGRFHGLVDLGGQVQADKNDARIELRPGAGISIETKKDLRFGVEGYGDLFVDSALKKSRWFGVGPNMSWTSGRFWLTASLLIGVYQIDTAPRVIWGVLF